MKKNSVCSFCGKNFGGARLFEGKSIAKDSITNICNDCSKIVAEWWNTRPKIELTALQYGFSIAYLHKYLMIDRELLDLIPHEIAERHCLIPLVREGSTIVVAMADPSNIFAIDDIKFLTGLTLDIRIADPDEIRETIERLYPRKLDQGIGGPKCECVEGDVPLADPGYAAFDEPEAGHKEQPPRPRRTSRRRDPHRLTSEKKTWTGATELLSAIVDKAIVGQWKGCTIAFLADGMLIVEPKRDAPKNAAKDILVVRQDNVLDLLKDLRTILGARASIEPERTTGDFSVIDMVVQGKRGRKRPRLSVVVNLVEKDNPNAPIHLTFTPKSS